MITIAITGGAATGKSVVARMLAEIWGEKAALFSSDAAVHELLTRPAIKTTLRGFFGSAVFNEANEVDRGKLRNVVFQDSSLRRKLEQILHPEVFKSGTEASRIAIESKRKLLVYEIPLLYEVDSKQKRDFDVVVGASEEVQRLRLGEKRGLEPDIIENLLKSQKPMGEKVHRADIVIWNDGTETELEEQVHMLTGFLHERLSGDELAPSLTA